MRFYIRAVYRFWILLVCPLYFFDTVSCLSKFQDWVFMSFPRFLVGLESLLTTPINCLPQLTLQYMTKRDSSGIKLPHTKHFAEILPSYLATFRFALCNTPKRAGS
ncbi:hypothetical protein GGS26DRAFT_566239 [Hypomontagnella submonticulosa]|nr:hypothetical protein GGS26DRAFT_566239 [Hypomontagnella submonticulosa]